MREILEGECMESLLLDYVKQLFSKEAHITSIEVENEPFKFVRFGLKKFEKINLVVSENDHEHRLSVIKKTYPCFDMPMLLSKDTCFRELLFFNSPIKKTFSRFFDIPFICIDEKEHAIYMRNCEEDLKRFGPPALPTEIAMKNLITRLAIKDAKLIDIKWEYSNDFYSYFDFMFRAFNDKLEKKEISLLNEQWPWFLKGLSKLKTFIGPVRLEKLKNLYSPDKVKNAVSKIPLSLHHGDFYFANIGFNKENKPLVIDWEMLMTAPIGFDFVILTNGIPPLQFSDLYEEWYISAYNNACDTQLTMKQFIQWTDLLRKYYFIIAETLDYLRFAFGNTYDSSDSEPEAKQNNYLQKLDLIMKMNSKRIY